MNTTNTGIDNILKHTPYNSYDDLFGAVYSNKAKIKLSNNACREIAKIEKPVFSNLGLYLGIIPAAITTIGISLYTSKYLLLLLLILDLFLPLVIYLFSNLNIKINWLAYVLLICDLFVFRLPLAFPIISASWVMCSWMVKIWGQITYKTSIKILQYNTDAFLWAFNSHNLLIEDSYGNVYSKTSLNNCEQSQYKKLLKLLKFTTNVRNVDEAIDKFSSFYISKGIDIPLDFYYYDNNISEEKKLEKLLKILEYGTGVTGIENVKEKFINFYKEKGQYIPEDIYK